MNLVAARSGDKDSLEVGKVTQCSLFEVLPPVFIAGLHSAVHMLLEAQMAAWARFSQGEYLQARSMHACIHA